MQFPGMGTPYQLILLGFVVRVRSALIDAHYMEVRFYMMSSHVLAGFIAYTFFLVYVSLDYSYGRRNALRLEKSPLP